MEYILQKYDHVRSHNSSLWSDKSQKKIYEFEYFKLKEMSSPTDEKFNTLIVDDEEHAITILMRHLKNHFPNLEADQAVSIKEMLEKVSQNKYDIIFLDNYLENEEGLYYIDEIKKHNPDVYVIAVSQDHNINLVLKMIENGASDFLTKEDIFEASGRFYATIHRAITFANGKRQVRNMFQTLIEEQQIFYAEFGLDQLKGIVLKYYDGPEELKDEVLNFGVRSITSLQDSPNTLAKLPYKKINYDVFVYVYGLHENPEYWSIEGAKMLFIPSAVTPLLLDPQNALSSEKLFEEANIEEKETIKQLKFKFCGI